MSRRWSASSLRRPLQLQGGGRRVNPPVPRPATRRQRSHGCTRTRPARASRVAQSGTPVEGFEVRDRDDVRGRARTMPGEVRPGGGAGQPKPPHGRPRASRSGEPAGGAAAARRAPPPETEPAKVEYSFSTSACPQRGQATPSRPARRAGAPRTGCRRPDNGTRRAAPRSSSATGLPGDGPGAWTRGGREGYARARAGFGTTPGNRLRFASRLPRPRAARRRLDSMSQALEEPPSPLQPAARRVGAVLAAPPAAAVAGAGRGRRRPRRGPSYDPSCYLCPGNSAPNGQRNPAYATTFAFDNDFPALLPASDVGAARRRRAARRGAGERPLPRDLLLAAPRSDAGRDGGGDDPARRRRLGGRGRRPSARDPRIRYVQVFENKGAMMGCSNPHPHCQVWATGHVPTIPARKLATQRAYFAAATAATCSATTSSGSSPRASASSSGTSTGSRSCRSGRCGRSRRCCCRVRRVADLPSLDARTSATRWPTRCGGRASATTTCSAPRSPTRWASTRGRPTASEHPYWRLHAVYFPPLLRSATVRKFLVGYELTAEPQRDLTAEDAAARLRAQAEVHYRRPPSDDRHRPPTASTPAPRRAPRPLRRALRRGRAARRGRARPRQPDRRAHRLQRRLRAADGDRPAPRWSSSGRAARPPCCAATRSPSARRASVRSTRLAPAGRQRLDVLRGRRRLGLRRGGPADPRPRPRGRRRRADRGGPLVLGGARAGDRARARRGRGRALGSRCAWRGSARRRRTATSG